MSRLTSDNWFWEPNLSTADVSALLSSNPSMAQLNLFDSNINVKDITCDISILMKAMPSRINWIAVDDFTWNIASLNAASDSNHHCYIEPDECNNSNDPKCNRRSKIYSLLSARKKYSEHLCPTMGIETCRSMTTFNRYQLYTKPSQ